ncbi:hypothetical protein ONZ45_g63 [Pleurotus djamor]|nr:hypothetical protein ONZ45_g63 [Pleurotus djamor]
MLRIWKQSWKGKNTKRHESPQSLDPNLQDEAEASTSSSRIPSGALADCDLIQESAPLSSVPDVVQPPTKLGHHHAASTPNEYVLSYHPAQSGLDTQLMKDLKQLDPQEHIFGRYFRASRCVLTEVGPCAADLVWRRSLPELSRLPNQQLQSQADSERGPSGNTESNVAELINTVKNWPYTMPNLDPTSRGFNVTPKFIKLTHVIRASSTTGKDFRGLIFVRKRTTAFAIADMLRSLGDDLVNIRPFVAVGNGQRPFDLSLSRDFSAGTYNLIIATKSLEDHDLPKASLVVLYDLVESHTSQAYVRARVRGEGHLVYMVEIDNNEQRRILSTITRPESDLLDWMKGISCDSRGRVPPSNLHEPTDPCHSDDEDEDFVSGRFVLDPTTSGRIYVQDATTVIYRFSAAMASNTQVGRPLFLFEDSHRPDSLPGVVCTITLPSINGLIPVRGPISDNMTQARREACLQACDYLTSIGALGSHYFPPAPPNSSQTTNHEPLSSTQARPHSHMSGARHYPQKKPDFWSNCGTGPVDRLYPLLVTIGQGDTSEAYGPMLILTRKPLPPLTPFKIFSGTSATVSLRGAAPLSIDQFRLQSLVSYTLRICRAISNKPFTCSIDQMGFLFAPLSPSIHDVLAKDNEALGLTPIEAHVPWESVSAAASTWAVALDLEDVDKLKHDLEDAVIQDRWVEFTRRYNAVCLRQDLTPSDKPADSPREAAYENIYEYCKAKRKGMVELKNPNQPLIMVDRLHPLSNCLSPMISLHTKTDKASAKYLIPELCARFTVPASIFRTAMAIPSILNRINDFLLVKELNAKLFRHEIREDLLHMALSTPSACNEYDYERLELLGDSFLKYLSSIYVYVMNPTANEGSLHQIRQPMISNKSLLQNASCAGLPGYIQSKPFAVRNWQPVGFSLLEASGDESQAPSPLVPGQSPDETAAIPEGHTKPKPKNKRKRRSVQYGTQLLGDKAVADVVESILGAAYLTGGRELALKASKAMNIPTPGIDTWSDFQQKAMAPHPAVTAPLKPGTIEAVEVIIGHTFARRHLLAQALTHTSVNSHDTTSYERLEFIGDAILDFMVIRYIYHRNLQLSPGALTLLKGAMVSNSALSAVCVWSGLYKHILFESSHLSSTISAYASQVKARHIEEQKAAKIEGRPEGQYWLELDAPKALSDVIESVIGAVFISDSFSTKGVEAFFDNVLKPFFDTYITLQTLSLHPTKTLLEMVQAQGCQHFELEKDNDGKLARCSIIVHDVVLVDAQDTTVAAAARRASSAAIDVLEGDPGFLARTCDCRSKNIKKTKINIEQVISGINDDAETDS